MRLNALVLAADGLVVHFCSLLVEDVRKLGFDWLDCLVNLQLFVYLRDCSVDDVGCTVQLILCIFVESVRDVLEHGDVRVDAHHQVVVQVSRDRQRVFQMLHVLRQLLDVLAQRNLVLLKRELFLS
jgi:hypothetical protein